MNVVKESNKVYITDDNGTVIAYVTFPSVKEGVVEINHTVVDPSLRGKGIANILLENAYDVIKENNLKAIATCSYAVKWFDKRKEKKDILVF